MFFITSEIVVNAYLYCRCWQYRQLTKVHRCPRPTRPDRARRLGFKNKQGNKRSTFQQCFGFSKFLCGSGSGTPKCLSSFGLWNVLPDPGYANNSADPDPGGISLDPYHCCRISGWTIMHHSEPCAKRIKPTLNWKNVFFKEWSVFKLYNLHNCMFRICGVPHLYAPWRAEEACGEGLSLRQA